MAFVTAHTRSHARSCICGRSSQAAEPHGLVNDGGKAVRACWRQMQRVVIMLCAERHRIPRVGDHACRHTVHGALPAPAALSNPFGNLRNRRFPCRHLIRWHHAVVSQVGVEICKRHYGHPRLLARIVEHLEPCHDCGSVRTLEHHVVHTLRSRRIVARGCASEAPERAHEHATGVLGRRSDVFPDLPRSAAAHACEQWSRCGRDGAGRCRSGGRPRCLPP